MSHHGGPGGCRPGKHIPELALVVLEKYPNLPDSRQRFSAIVNGYNAHLEPFLIESASGFRQIRAIQSWRVDGARLCIRYPSSEYRHHSLAWRSSERTELPDSTERRGKIQRGRENSLAGVADGSFFNVL